MFLVPVPILRFVASRFEKATADTLPLGARPIILCGLLNENTPLAHYRLYTNWGVHSSKDFI